MAKKIIFSLLLLLPGYMVLCGEDLSGYYLSYASHKGLLFFVKPRSMPPDVGSCAKGKMLYDITCPVATDTVSFTVTVRAGEPLASDTVWIVSPDGCRTGKPLERIYVDTCKSGWEHRVRFCLSFAEYKRLYAYDAPYRLSFGRGEACIAYRFPMKKWLKERRIMGGIIRLIELNR